MLVGEVEVASESPWPPNQPSRAKAGLREAKARERDIANMALFGPSQREQNSKACPPGLFPGFQPIRPYLGVIIPVM